MRGTILFLSAILISIASAYGQKITYSSSFQEAKKLAEEKQKPLAVLFTIEPPVPTPNFLKGLSDQAVIEKYNSSFINYRVAKEDTASRQLIMDYKIYRFPGLLFLDPKGGVIFSDVAFLSRAETLLELADRALTASKEKSLVDYDAEFSSGNNSRDFLKAYIVKRQKAGIVDNSALIEKYAANLAVKDLDDYKEVLFILRAGPLVDSNAYRLAHLNRRVIDSIYKTEPSADRSAMNNAIISNTMNKAIAQKNVARASAVANFTRLTWSADVMEGQKNYYAKMLQYYQAVKDTTQYLQMAVGFFDQYYMNITVDSIRKKDSLNFEAAKARARLTAVPMRDSSVKTFSFTYAKDDRFATDLNNVAWYFHQIAGQNERYLLKAMLWSKRAVEMSPKPAFYDTYAHLLYKLKFYSEAESMGLKSVELARAQKADARKYEEVYKKIKTKSL